MTTSSKGVHSELERSDVAENALACLHEEDYDKYYSGSDKCFDHRTSLFVVGRKKSITSLNGEWNFTRDLYDTGLRQRWFTWSESPEVDKSGPYDYDPFDDNKCIVPSCWNMIDDIHYLFEGAGWYTRVITVPQQASPDEVYWTYLRIGAALYEAKVFLDGKFLGHHNGGSTPFFVPLTAHVSPGTTHRLQVCVNNRRSRDRVPMRHTDWFNYGGIYRDVDLVQVPKVYIRDIFVFLSRMGTSTNPTHEITISGCVARPTSIPGGQPWPTLEITWPEQESIQPLVVELGPQLEQDMVGGEEGLSVTKFEVTVQVDISSFLLWSPDHPHLHLVRAVCGGDTVQDRIGLRKIETRGQYIYLNGERVTLRGISVHEDDRDLGKVSDESDLRRRFQHARELGCNFLRLAHYPHHERAAQLADELGFMLWEEIPVYWAINFGREDTLIDARNQLTELIVRDRNRASVIIWSVGNENADTDDRLSFMQQLVNVCRDLDPSRLVSAACLVNSSKMMVEDRLAPSLDIIGLNEYFGWYTTDIDQLDALLANSAPDKPVIITETGAGAVTGMRGAKGDYFTEDHMVWVYQEQTKRIARYSFVAGLTPWILYDFRAERRRNKYQKGWNLKGLIDKDKATKKLAFTVLQEFYKTWNK